MSGKHLKCILSVDVRRMPYAVHTHTRHTFIYFICLSRLRCTHRVCTRECESWKPEQQTHILFSFGRVFMWCICASLWIMIWTLKSEFPYTNEWNEFCDHWLNAVDSCRLYDTAWMPPSPHSNEVWKKNSRKKTKILLNALCESSWAPHHYLLVQNELYDDSMEWWSFSFVNGTHLPYRECRWFW